MHKFIRRALATVAVFSTSLAFAGDRFVSVPWNSLKFDPPNDTHDGHSAYTIRVRTSAVYEPRIVLDGAGEAFVEYDSTNSWGTFPASPTRMLLRVPDGAPLTGRIFFAADQGKSSVSHFAITDAGAEPDSRGAFYQVAEAHYRRLADEGLPGAAWFRHQAFVAHAARGLDPNATGAEASTPTRWFGPPHSFDDTLELFSGERALAENLDLDRGLRGVKGEEATIDVASIEGVTTRAMDWKPLVKDLAPELDPLAKSIPGDQHGVFFPSFDAMLRVFDEVDREGTPVLEFFEARAEDQRTKERYQEQLCMPLSAFARLLGPSVVSSVAITGSDPFLPSGADLALVFECKQPDVLEKYVMTRHLEAKSKGAKVVGGSVGSAKYGGVRSDDRSVSSYMARFGELLVVTNSLAQLERIAATLDGANSSLATTDEYVWFRDRYKRGDASESALVVLSDATIRRWSGPRSRIGESRRVRAAAAMAEIQAQHLIELANGTLTPGASAADPSLPFSADFTWTKHGVYSPIFGSLAFLTPIAELSIDKVTPSEKQAYDNFRVGFQNRWRNYFDPIALRVCFSDTKLAADVTVMPLTVSSDYREFADLTRGAKLATGSGDAHDGTLFHFALAFSENSNTGRMFSNTFGPYTNQFGADPLGWIGGGVAFFADRDAFWEELGKAPDRDEFFQKNLYRLPMALEVDVKDSLKLVAFLTAARAFVDTVAPDMSTWSTEKWHEQSYVKISPQAESLSEELSQIAIYYAAMPDSFVVSLREDVVQRAIDRRIARKAGKADPLRDRPWLGSSLGLRVERDVFDIAGGFESTELDDELASTAWSAIPILDEWKRLFPKEDPIAVHERLWGVRLSSPGGGTFAWNDALETMESSEYGSPGAPKKGPRLPKSLERFLRGEFGLSFEGDGLRVRGELERSTK